MNNKIKTKDILNMIDIINYSTGNKNIKFNKKIKYVFYSPDATYFSQKINEKISQSLEDFKKIIIDKKNIILDFWKVNKDLKNTFLKIIFESIFINLDKEVSKVYLEIEQKEILMEDIEHIVEVIECFYEENNQLEIYKDWVNRKINSISSKIFSYTSREFAKLIIKTKYKENSFLEKINNQIFNKKTPKSLQLLNSLISLKFSNELSWSLINSDIDNDEYIGFSTYLNDINTLFKCIEDDIFKLDFLVLKKIGKENYEKHFPKKNGKLENYDEKVTKLVFKELFKDTKDFHYFNKRYGFFQKENSEIFKDMFFINLGCLFKNEKLLFEKYINYLKDSYLRINNDEEFKKALSVIGSNSINDDYFDSNIQYLDKWQEDWYKNKFNHNEYKDEIEKIINIKIKKEVEELFNSKNIKYKIENLNFDFISRTKDGISIWDPVLLTFEKYYDELKNYKEWKENFIYRFIYENEMLNFSEEQKKYKTIILDSFNETNFYKNSKKILKDFLDNSVIDKLNPIIFSENNLLSANSRYEFTKFEYCGDILYEIIISALQLKGVIKIKEKNEHYLSSKFQNILAKEIKMQELIQSSNLFFNKNNKKRQGFELADYLEALLFNIYNNSNFETAFNFIKKLIERSAPEFLFKHELNYMHNKINSIKDMEWIDKLMENYNIFDEQYLYETNYNNSEKNKIQNNYIQFVNKPRLPSSERQVQKLIKRIFELFIKIYSFEKVNFKKQIYNFLTLEMHEHDFMYYNVLSKIQFPYLTIKVLYWNVILNYFLYDFDKFIEQVKYQVSENEK